MTPITFDSQRRLSIQSAIDEADFDILICTLPSNVMLSGYWPMIGTAIAVFGRDGKLGLIAPEDELEFIGDSLADFIFSFSAPKLDNLCSPTDVLQVPLKSAIESLGIRQNARVGVESAAWSQPAPYVSLYSYGSELRSIVHNLFPQFMVAEADETLNLLRSIKTAKEIDRIRLACRVAGQAFHSGARLIEQGMTEMHASLLFRSALLEGGIESGESVRTEAFAFCMSGENSVKAQRAYAQSGRRRLEPGDPALVHCNSHINGYWTDITRTFTPGSPTDRLRKMYTTVLAARDAALQAIRPGRIAKDVDLAARSVILDAGYGNDEFAHGTGHGVGFAAIYANALPRIHPLSTDIIEEGMVFNIEPAIYIPGYAGVRHCDMVAVTESGAELLTNFQSTTEELFIERTGR